MKAERRQSKPVHFSCIVAKPRHLVFRPYLWDMNKPEYEVRDRGYYFKFYNPTIDVKLIRMFLEDNGFMELDAAN
jgi:hypothetical protein